MRPPLAVVLLILAVPLMGSDCYVAGRVGGPPQPPPDDVTPPPPGSGGGGGIIIVTSGGAVASAAPEEAARIERSRVEAVLAVSVWTPPALEPMASASSGQEPQAIAPLDLEGGLAAPGETSRLSASAAVPEPTALVLFACGLWVASRIGRARDERAIMGQGR